MFVLSNHNRFCKQLQDIPEVKFLWFAESCRNRLWHGNTSDLKDPRRIPILYHGSSNFLWSMSIPSHATANERPNTVLIKNNNTNNRTAISRFSSNRLLVFNVISPLSVGHYELKLSPFTNFELLVSFLEFNLTLLFEKRQKTNR